MGFSFILTSPGPDTALTEEGLHQYDREGGI